MIRVKLFNLSEADEELVVSIIATALEGTTIGGRDLRGYTYSDRTPGKSKRDF